MVFRYLFLLTLVGILSGATLFAGSHEVLIPIVARTAGAHGSEWRTDVVISNPAHRGNAVPVMIVFSPNDGAVQTASADLIPRQTLVLRDVLRSSFGVESGSGLLRIQSLAPTAEIIARARIYNIGGAQGEFDQSVTGYPTDSLTREHLLSGLSGVAGNRTNIGVSNPWSVPVTVSLSLFHASGDFRGSVSTVVPAGKVVQWNDIFAQLGKEPFEDATVVVNAGFGVYAYASVVRSDSGDATFVAGSGVRFGNELLLPAACANPAPVNLTPPGSQEASGWIVVFRDDVADPEALARQLAAQYGFTVRTFYADAFKGFSADFGQETLAELRCLPSIAWISQNTVVNPD
jgi:hypothetical protein